MASGIDKVSFIAQRLITIQDSNRGNIGLFQFYIITMVALYRFQWGPLQNNSPLASVFSFEVQILIVKHYYERSHTYQQKITSKSINQEITLDGT